jgi:hypothetical protein
MATHMRIAIKHNGDSAYSIPEGEFVLVTSLRYWERGRWVLWGFDSLSHSLGIKTLGTFCED